MVSTRGPGPKSSFSENERVLCYEPDITKAKVLYDSKVLEVYESRDKRGRRITEYLIHFQGWNSSWDRRVGEELVLKSTAENRQLQKDLAEKSQLQFGAYLYRKDRRKRNSKGFESKKDEKMSRKEDPDHSQDLDTESYSSSAESSVEVEDKVVLRLSESLKGFLEADYIAVKMHSRLVKLASNVTVITVLENYVKHNAIKYICGTLKRDKLKRRNSQTKHERDHIVDPDKFANNLNICKEVADGLRIYFDFTLKDFLLYEPERKQYEEIFTQELINGGYKHTPSDRPYFLDYLPQNKPPPPPPPIPELMEFGGTIAEQHAAEESARRRLRSHRTDDSDFSLLFEGGMSGSESCQSGIVVSNQNVAISELLKSVLPSNTSLPLPYRVRHLLQNTLTWELLPKDAPVEPSMIYGAIHLARLIVKLPEFLSATNIAEDKLRLVLKHLDDFMEFLEEHREWFGTEQYTNATTTGGVNN